MRYYHPGASADIATVLVDHPTLGPCVVAPPAHWQVHPLTRTATPAYVPAKPGSLTFAVEGRFYVVPPGGYCDVPDHIPRSVVRDMAPQLVTSAPALAAVPPPMKKVS